MNTEIIDDTSIEAPLISPLRNALTWWEKKRMWYNILVGVSGLIAIVLYANYFSLGEIIGLLLYGVVLNIFYSTGFILEALNIYYLKQKFQIEYLRYPLLIIGTVLSSILTYVWAVIYFTW